MQVVTEAQPGEARVGRPPLRLADRALRALERHRARQGPGDGRDRRRADEPRRRGQDRRREGRRAGRRRRRSPRTRSSRSTTGRGSPSAPASRRPSSPAARSATRRSSRPRTRRARRWSSPAAATSCTRRRPAQLAGDQAPVGLLVLRDHPLGRELLLGDRAHLARGRAPRALIDMRPMSSSTVSATMPPRRCSTTSGTAPRRGRQDGRAARHRLDHDEAERLGPLDREDGRGAPAGAGAPSPRATPRRRTRCRRRGRAARWRRSAPARACRASCRRASAAGRPRGRSAPRCGPPCRATSGRGRAGSRRSRVERVVVEVDGVVAGCEPGQVGKRRALVVRERDQPHARAHLRDLRVDEPGLAAQGAVDGVAERRLDHLAERAGQRPGVVVHDVELARPARGR